MKKGVLIAALVIVVACSTAVSTPALAEIFRPPGDVSGDGAITLEDAILALKVLSHIASSSTVDQDADVDSDNKFGMAEALYILQIVSGIRTGPPGPPPPWAKTYGGGGFDWPFCIKQTSDQGYVVVGRTNSFGAGGNDVWVLKLEPDGAVEWEKTYGKGGDDRGSAVLLTSDNGYLVAGGGVFSGGSGGSDFWLLKLESDGKVGWQKTADWDGKAIKFSNYASAIQQTKDDGYIVAGWVYTIPAPMDPGGYMDLGVLKLGKDLTVEWYKTYGGPGTEGFGAEAVQQTPDGGYILLGNTPYDGGAGSYDIWLLKLNPDGTEDWQKRYGGADLDFAEDMQLTSGGGYIVAGYTKSFGALNNNYDAWILKLDKNGTVVWQKTYGGTANDAANAVRQTSDKGYIVAGYTGSSGAGGNDVWVLKIKPDGTVVWQRTYGGTGSDMAYSIEQTKYGNYIVAGLTSSFGAGGSDFWVLRLNTDGELGCSQVGETETSVEPKVTEASPSENPLPGRTWGDFQVRDISIEGIESEAGIKKQCD